MGGLVAGGLVTTPAGTPFISGAVNAELLGTLEEDTVLDLVASLHDGSGGEGPAGTAATLVLDNVTGTRVAPVLVSGDGEVLERGRLSLPLLQVNVELFLLSLVGSSIKLFQSPVREGLVIDSVEHVGGLVAMSDELLLSSPVLFESQVVLLVSLVTLSEFSHPVDETVFDVGLGCGNLA